MSEISRGILAGCEVFAGAAGVVWEVQRLVGGEGFRLIVAEFGGIIFVGDRAVCGVLGVCVGV